ncbi:N-(5'-phosphoribosyl)anthranilate isomerase [Clostridia bacterium]|nr:N-(5'-phosphoribosyl)anthranilate isomerase [Clostridia bacterium]
MKIKICGLKSYEDVDIINVCKPDYAGFVFAKGRHLLTKDEARELVSRLDPRITPVGVFVNEDLESLAEIVRYCGLHAVQLHGDEDDLYIKKAGNVRVIKCVRTRDTGSVQKGLATSADYVLFDTFDTKERGGTGRLADASLIPKDLSKPYFLAGGINPENIEQVLRDNPNAYAVDISSGAEDESGKSFEKVSKLVQTVREFEV